jgi:hypothetical protein
MYAALHHNATTNLSGLTTFQDAVRSEPGVEGRCGSMSRGLALDNQHAHALGAADPVTYRRHIENRIRAGNTTLP